MSWGDPLVETSDSLKRSVKKRRRRRRPRPRVEDEKKR